MVGKDITSTLPHRSGTNREHEETVTRGQRLSDAVARMVGSWTFIIVQSTIVIIWVGLNIYGYIEHWDPYPYILLNLLFSTQAAYTAPIIMMSQNRQNERDRVRAAADYSTDLAAKAEIEKLTRQMEKLEKEKIDLILARLPEMK